MKEEGKEGKSDTTNTNVLPRCQCIGGLYSTINVTSVRREQRECVDVCIMTMRR